MTESSNDNWRMLNSLDSSWKKTFRVNKYVCSDKALNSRLVK